MTDLQPIIEIFEPVSIVSEMANGSDVLVSIPSDVIERVTDGDPDPKFATFVIESGWSRAKRLWDLPVFDSVHEQISKGNSNGDPIVGYLGHIKPEDSGFAFPEIQFQWLRSALKRVGDKAHLFTKAYVLPETRARFYLKKGLAKSVSWAGDAGQIPFQKGVRITDFALESIDLARPGKAGMSARLVGGLTSEMSTSGGNEVKPEEIAALQENELRAHNPGLVQTIEQEATKPLSTKVSEMENEQTTLKAEADKLPELRKLLGISDEADPIETVKRLLEEAKKAGRGVRERVLDAVLAKKFKDSDVTLVRRILVGEMEGSQVEITGDDEKDEKAISEMVNSLIDKDADLKSLVSEMEDTPPRLPGTSTRDSNGEKKELKAGDETSLFSVRSRR